MSEAVGFINSGASGMRIVLWFATMLFFVAFFSYGYVLWARAKKRRSGHTSDE